MGLESEQNCPDFRLFLRSALYLVGPFLQSIPLVLSTEYDNRFVGSFKLFDELFGRNVFLLDSFDRVVDVGP